VLKTPPASKLILKAAGLQKGSGTPQKATATITEDQLREIAEIKLPDLNATTVEAAMDVVHGTARNMGIAVEGRQHRTK
jgi:large subunit ribosomal protein L11